MVRVPGRSVLNESDDKILVDPYPTGTDDLTPGSCGSGQTMPVSIDVAVHVRPFSYKYAILTVKI